MRGNFTLCTISSSASSATPVRCSVCLWWRLIFQSSLSSTSDQVVVFGRQYTLVRLDAGRLPFETGSLAAIHAGAAMHCWPNPSLAVSSLRISCYLSPVPFLKLSSEPCYEYSRRTVMSLERQILQVTVFCNDVSNACKPQTRKNHIIVTVCDTVTLLFRFSDLRALLMYDFWKMSQSFFLIVSKPLEMRLHAASAITSLMDECNGLSKFAWREALVCIWCTLQGSGGQAGRCRRLVRVDTVCCR